MCFAAKQELMGKNLRLAFATSVLRVPLSALLLVAYDRVLDSLSFARGSVEGDGS